MAEPRRRSRAAATLLGAIVAAVVVSAAVAGTKTASTTVPLHARGTATATCRKGQQAMLGGFATTLTEPGPYVHPSALVLSGRSAKARGVNEEGPGGVGAGAGTVKAYAYCGTRVFLGKASAFNTVPPGMRASATAKCPGGMPLAVGGFRADISPSGSGPLVYVDGLERVGKSKWRASAINDGSSPGKVEALAYCYAGSYPVSTVTRSVLVDPVKTGSVTAKCPAGKKVAFGGVRSEHYGTGGGELQLSSMRRSGKRGWKVSALKYANEIGRLTAIAYCH